MLKLSGEMGGMGAGRVWKESSSQSGSQSCGVGMKVLLMLWLAFLGGGWLTTTLRESGTYAHTPCSRAENHEIGDKSKVTAVGFEPTPLRTGAWSQRLRPLGQTVHAPDKSLV